MSRYSCSVIAPLAVHPRRLFRLTEYRQCNYSGSNLHRARQTHTTKTREKTHTQDNKIIKIAQDIALQELQKSTRATDTLFELAG